MTDKRKRGERIPGSVAEAEEKGGREEGANDDELPAPQVRTSHVLRVPHSLAPSRRPPPLLPPLRLNCENPRKRRGKEKELPDTAPLRRRKKEGNCCRQSQNEFDPSGREGRKERDTTRSHAEYACPPSVVVVHVVLPRPHFVSGRLARSAVGVVRVYSRRGMQIIMGESEEKPRAEDRTNQGLLKSENNQWE